MSHRVYSYLFPSYRLLENRDHKTISSKHFKQSLRSAHFKKKIKNKKCSKRWQEHSMKREGNKNLKIEQKPFCFEKGKGRSPKIGDQPDIIISVYYMYNISLKKYPALPPPPPHSFYILHKVLPFHDQLHLLTQFSHVNTCSLQCSHLAHSTAKFLPHYISLMWASHASARSKMSLLRQPQAGHLLTGPNSLSEQTLKTNVAVFSPLRHASHFLICT